MSNPDDKERKVEQKEPAEGKDLVHQDSKPKKKDAEDKTSLQTGVPDIDKVFEGMPPKVRRTFQMAMTGFSGGPGLNPLFEKFNEDHIHKFLDYTQRDDDHNYKFRCSNRWFALTFAALGLGVFIFLIIYLLPANKEILVDLLKLIVAFAGGVGSGVGLKSYLDRRR